MKALVTGSAGLVGRHFVNYLARDGWDIEGCDIAYPASHDRHADCREVFQFADPHVDLLVHCAATIPPIDERHRCDLAVANDFALNSAMFQWARRARPTKIVYFSSSAAYPSDLQRNPWKLREGDLDLEYIRTPDGMYGLTKLVGELQAVEARKLGLDILVVRPFTGYAWDQAPTYPFPRFVDRAEAQGGPLHRLGERQPGPGPDPHRGHRRLCHDPPRRRPARPGQYREWRAHHHDGHGAEGLRALRLLPHIRR